MIRGGKGGNAQRLMLTNIRGNNETRSEEKKLIWILENVPWWTITGIFKTSDINLIMYNDYSKLTSKTFHRNK